MKKNETDLLTREALESPLIKELRDLAYSLCGVSFVILCDQMINIPGVAIQCGSRSP